MSGSIAVVGCGSTVGCLYITVRFEVCGEGDGHSGVGELADRAEGVGEVVGPGGGVFFGDAAVAVQVGVCAVGEDLGEAVFKVQGVAGGGGVHGLLQAVAKPIINEAVAAAALGDGGDAVGGGVWGDVRVGGLLDVTNNAVASK